MNTKGLYTVSILFFFAICWIGVDAQKINFLSNVDRNAYIKWPILNYFNNRYELVISFFPSTGQLQSGYLHRIFAVKGTKYYKIDCLVNFSGDVQSPDNVIIEKTRRFSEKKGKAFMDSLVSHHIFTLEPQDNWRNCFSYDSVHKQEVAHYISDGGSVRLEIFNKKSYRNNTYYAVDFYIENCPSEPARNIQALIDLFEKKW